MDRPPDGRLSALFRMPARRANRKRENGRVAAGMDQPLPSALSSNDPLVLKLPPRQLRSRSSGWGAISQRSTRRRPAKSRMAARTYRVARSAIQRNAIVEPSMAPASAPTAKRGAAKPSLWPPIRTPSKPTAELHRMNGGESAAARFAEAQPRATSIGVIKAPPPTPVSPDSKPEAAPASAAGSGERWHRSRLN